MKKCVSISEFHFLTLDGVTLVIIICGTKVSRLSCQQKSLETWYHGIEKNKLINVAIDHHIPISKQ